MSFNDHFPESNSIYQVRVNGKFNNNLVTDTNTPAPLADALKSEIPQIEYATKKTNWGPLLLINKDQNALWESGLFASDDFFEVFSPVVNIGDPNKALRAGQQIILSRSAALKMFNGMPDLGETLLAEGQDGTLKAYTLDAIVEDLQANSTKQFDWVINFKEIEQPWMHWGNSSYHTYVKVTQMLP